MTCTFVVNTLTHCDSRKITISGKKKFRKLYCFLWFWSEVRQKMEVQHTTLANKDIYKEILRFYWLDGNVGSVKKICLGVLQILLSTVKYFINFPKNWFISVKLFTVYNCNKIVTFKRKQEYKLEKHMIKSTEKKKPYIFTNLTMWPPKNLITIIYILLWDN